MILRYEGQKVPFLVVKNRFRRFQILGEPVSSGEQNQSSENLSL